MISKIKLLFIIIIAFSLTMIAKKNIQKNKNKKIVVITGATKGLGRALVSEFVKLGWKVAGCGLSSELIESLAKEYGDDHNFDVVDINNFTEVEQWSENVLAELGVPDIIINNAGAINKKSKLWQISESEFKKVIETNVIGTFNVIKVYVPEMIKEKKGIIINISSSWGRKGEAMFAPYSASKFAIEGLTQALSKELPKELIAVTLDPGGGINTDMLKECYAQEAKKYQSPQEWAKKAVPFILKINTKDNGKSLTIS